MPNEHDQGDPILKEIPPQRASALSRCALCNKTFDDVETHSCSSLRATDDPLIGTTIGGHYEIQQCLGRGGMSIVYKAKDVLIGRFVAVKLLLLQSGINAKALLRFQQEARAAAQLDHPNIIKVYEFNVPENGSPYLILDYVEGPSIADVLEVQHRIDQKRALRILITVCEALEHAHSKGVVHRDLKPSNIMLAQSKEAQEVVKIVDFGIAKLHEFEGTQNQLTKSGEIFGSPLYMSPEQCSGETVTKASDIYSLGCVMYEMLTSRPPFVGINALETMLMQKSEAPKKLSESRPSLENADRLDMIVLKALAKSPKDRFASMKEMKEALLDVLEGKQGSSFLDNLSNRFSTARARDAAGQRKSKPAVLLVGVLLLALAGALALNMMTAEHKTKSAPPPAIEEVKGDFLTLYKQAQGLMDRNQLDQATPLAHQCFKMTAENSTGADHLAALKLMTDLAYLTENKEYRRWQSAVFAARQRFDETLLQSADELRSRLQKESGAVTADESASERRRALLSETVKFSDSLLDNHAYAIANSLLSPARAIAEQPAMEDKDLLASILTRQGRALAHTGKLHEGEEPILHAIELLESAPKKNYLQIGRSKLALCTICIKSQELDKAAQLLRDVRATCIENLPPDSADRADLYQQLADAELSCNASGNAYEDYSRSLTIFSKQANHHDLQMAVCELGLSNASKLQNRPLESMQHTQKALDLFESSPMASDTDFRDTLALAALSPNLPHELNRQILFKRVLSLGFRVPRSPSFALLVRDMGLWYKKRQDWVSATTYLRRAAEILLTCNQYPKNNAYALILADLGACYEHQDQLATSATSYEMALKCWKQPNADKETRLLIERNLAHVRQRMTQKDSIPVNHPQGKTEANSL